MNHCPLLFVCVPIWSVHHCLNNIISLHIVAVLLGLWFCFLFKIIRRKKRETERSLKIVENKVQVWNAFDIRSEKARERETETERQRDRETERQRDRETEGDRGRQRDRETERQRDRGRQIDRETDRQTDRDRQSERERQRETERDRESTGVKGHGMSLQTLNALDFCLSSGETCLHVTTLVNITLHITMELYFGE